MSIGIHFDALTLGHAGRPVVRNLTGDMPSGTLLAVVGANGTGKTTLLKTIAGILRPLCGRITFTGDMTGGIAHLPQRLDLDLSFPISVHNFAAMGLWQTTGAFKAIDASLMDKIENALNVVGLYDLKEQPIGVLSGGQVQRLLFARLILQDAPLILLDEPFTALDEHTTQNLIDCIERWHDDGRTIAIVMHDLNLVRKYMPQTLMLNPGFTTWGNTADVLEHNAIYIQKALCNHVRPVDLAMTSHNSPDHCVET